LFSYWKALVDKNMLKDENGRCVLKVEIALRGTIQ
jgi:hypothetical protein